MGKCCKSPGLRIGKQKSIKAIKGSYMGSCVPVRDIPRFISLYKQGRLPVDKLISRKVTLDEVNEGFDRLQNGETIRQICVPHV